MKIKLSDNMKKTYVSPLANEVNVITEAIMDASKVIYTNETADSQNGGQLGNKNRGEWGNLWGK